MAFSLQAKYVFLTYSDAAAVDSLEGLDAFLRSKMPAKAVVGRELHQNGEPHYHALLYFDPRIHVRDSRFFDYCGVHPKIEGARRRQAALEYVIKDGDYLNHGFDIREEKGVLEAVQQSIEAGGSHAEMVTRAVELSGIAGLRMIQQIDTYIGYKRRPSALHQPIRDMGTFTFIRNEELGPAVLKFMADCQAGPDAGRVGRHSLWLYGATRLGKTEMARSIGVHWYMSTSWNVHCFDDNAEYGVVDDIDWQAFRPYFKAILGLQKNITVTDKYTKKVTFKHGRPVIMISNELPALSEEELGWLNGNVKMIRVLGSLFDEEDEAQVVGVMSVEQGGPMESQ